jgi:hypothetical protein
MTYVVLRSNSPVEVGVKERELLEDILADTGNFAKEEEGEDTGTDTKGGGNSTAVNVMG